jgi:uncharacterized membrane protein YphA (DoxX/SURF4 family)
MTRPTLLQVATFAIALVFAAHGVLRLLHPEFNILRFAVLGWPAWSVWAVSIAEISGAILLVRTASFPLGAVVLAIVSGAFLLTYARIGSPEAGVGSAGLLSALLGLAFLRRARRRAPGSR